MSYIDNNLVPNERVMYRAHLHWKIFAPALLLVVLTIVLVTLGGITKSVDHPEGGKWFFMASGAAIIAALAAFLWELLNYKSSEFAVTDKRVIIKSGLFNRHTMETLLTKVENISVEQGVWGRMFNYGTIRVTGTGGTTEPFADIARPLEFRKHVQAETITWEERKDSGAPAPAAAVAGGPLREERECPFCAERILAKAKVCRFCGREIPAGA